MRGAVDAGIFVGSFRRHLVKKVGADIAVRHMALWNAGSSVVAVTRPWTPMVQIQRAVTVSQLSQSNVAVGKWLQR